MTTTTEADQVAVAILTWHQPGNPLPNQVVYPWDLVDEARARARQLRDEQGMERVRLRRALHNRGGLGYATIHRG